MLIDADDELPYDRPPLSKAMLTGDSQAAVPLLTREQAEAIDIELRLDEFRVLERLIESLPTFLGVLDVQPG